MRQNYSYKPVTRLELAGPVSRPTREMGVFSKPARIAPLRVAGVPSHPHPASSIAQTHPAIPLRARTDHVRVDATRRHGLVTPIQPRRRRVPVRQPDQTPVAHAGYPVVGGTPEGDLARGLLPQGMVQGMSEPPAHVFWRRAFLRALAHSQRQFA